MLLAVDILKAAFFNGINQNMIFSCFSMWSLYIPAVPEVRDEAYTGFLVAGSYRSLAILFLFCCCFSDRLYYYSRPHT